MLVGDDFYIQYIRTARGREVKVESYAGRGFGFLDTVFS